MVIDAVNQTLDLSTLNIKALADRRFGIGFDQLLLVEPARSADVDFAYRIFNADGGEVEQCGNGARCFARFVHEQGLSNKNPLVVETHCGIITLHCVDNNQVRVDMGAPIFKAEHIPVQANINDNQQISLALEGFDKHFTFGVVSMGNPHAVLQVEHFDDQLIFQLGSLLQNHPAFPAQVNVGFVQIASRSEINLRVFERGVGETLACGTGACAAVVTGILQNKLDNQVTVHLSGGDLSIEWAGDFAPVIMQGDASTVFTGEIEPEKYQRK